MTYLYTKMLTSGLKHAMMGAIELETVFTWYDCNNVPRENSRRDYMKTLPAIWSMRFWVRFGFAFIFLSFVFKVFHN